MGDKGRVLLVNPWIYDFAAHNLWIEPLGLLTIAAVLRACGYTVSVLDCLAPHAGMPRARSDGSGKFLKTRIDKPAAVAHVPRRYGRYGLPVELFDQMLASIPIPDLVMMTSGMTFWYPGVFEAIRRVRARLGSVPVVLGGVYATLCANHARLHSGADCVIAGPGVAAALRKADQITGSESESEQFADPRAWPVAAHDLVQRPFVAAVTSFGCPYHCTYCASHCLQPVFVQRDPQLIVDEIVAGRQRGIRDFVFYDDALLLGASRHIACVLEGVLARVNDVRFHTPNGLHAREITAELAGLMYRAGFVTIRLSLETTDSERQRATGGKVDTVAFERAVSLLQAAGFGGRELGAYILTGLPGQPLSEVEESVRFVHRLGIQVKLALFSPIPGTPEGDRGLSGGSDPLLHNNTVYPYLLGEDHVSNLERIKLVAKRGNAAILSEE